MSVQIYKFLLSKSLLLVKTNKKIFKIRLKLQNFPRVLQNYLIFNAFFSKILVKSQENFEKSQESFSKRSGNSQKNSEKISQHDLGQP